MSDFSINLNPRGGREITQIGNKILLTLFLAFFLALGCAFTGLVISALIDEAKIRTWKSTNCEILQSSVKEMTNRRNSSNPFKFLVSYRYFADGRDYFSEQFKTHLPTFSSYADAQHLVDLYSKGSHTNCYVNPKNHSQSVLRRGDFWMLLFLPLPLLFVLIGGGGIYYTWHPPKKTPRSSVPRSRNQPMSLRSNFLFFSVFLLVGAIGIYFLFVRVVIQVQQAQSWVEVPCTIISSDVVSHSGNHGSTYSVDIFYRYEFAGRPHKSNRYQFMSGSSSGYNAKQAIVNRYWPNSHTNCFVNPLNPDDAVLIRNFTPDTLFGLIPLVFFLIGAFGLVSLWRKRKKTGTNVGIETSL